MEPREPVPELHAGFRSEGAHPTGWADGRRHLEEAEVFWLSTVRPDGRPHVTPLLAVWCADAMYFCTGSDERKTKNLKRNPHCILTTGRNTLDESLDVVVEGQVTNVSEVWPRRHDSARKDTGLPCRPYDATWLRQG